MNRNDRSITGFTMIAHATFHVYELSIPIFLVVWLVVFDTTAAVLGLIVGAGYALVGFGALPSGLLADRYGSKTLVLVSLTVMGAGFALLSLAPTIGVLAAAILLWGLGASIYHPAGLSLLSRGTELRGTAFAYHGAAGNIGTVAGPFAAAIGLALFDWRTVTLAFVLPAIIAVLLSFRLDFDETAGVDAADSLPTQPDGGITTPREFLTSSKALLTGGVLAVFGIVMVYGLYFRGLITFLPEILAGIPAFAPVEIAGHTFAPSQLVFSGLLLVGVLGQYAGGRLSDLISVERTLLFSSVMLVLASLLFIPAADASVPVLLFVLVVIGFFLFFVAPVYQAAIANYAAADAHGLTYGYTYLGSFGVGAIGAPIAGVALVYADASTLFIVLAGIVGIASLLSLLLLLRYAHSPTRRTTP